MRIAQRWDAIQADIDAREEAKLCNKTYVLEKLENGDTLKELLARSRYYCSSQRTYGPPNRNSGHKFFSSDIPTRFERDVWSCHSLRMFYAKNSVRNATRLNLAHWYDRVARAEFKSFDVLAGTTYEHYDDIINYFVERSTNAVESLNAELKVFRAQLHGVNELPFFLFRGFNIFA